MLVDELKELADDFRKRQDLTILNNLHDTVISICRERAINGMYYSEVNTGTSKKEIVDALVRMLGDDGFVVGEPRYISSESIYIVRVVWGKPNETN